MAARYNGVVGWFWGRVSHFNFDKYWKYREKIASRKAGGVMRWYYLYYVKKTDSYHNASLGTHLNFMCAEFASRPVLPHGLNGIIVTNEAKIGKNCTIYHQVTIGGANGGAPVIGDDVMIGAGAKIVGNIKIGNGVKVGAGCVVTINVPDNSTVVLPEARIIFSRQENVI